MSQSSKKNNFVPDLIPFDITRCAHKSLSLLSETKDDRFIPPTGLRRHGIYITHSHSHSRVCTFSWVSSLKLVDALSCCETFAICINTSSPTTPS